MYRRRTMIIFLTICLTAIAGGIAFMLGDSTRLRLLRYDLNPDILSRVTDKVSDRKLVEYFNRDTNQFELVIYFDNRQIVWIEHPYRKVKQFKEAVNDNEIKFHPTNGNLLIVNGEEFPITKVK